VSAPDDAPLEYLRGHLEEALATDPRVMEQSLSVRVDHDTLVITGAVPTPERCAGVDDVARDLAPSTVVRNHVQVVQLEEPDSTEPV
jgi:hypothetical protein